MQIINEHHSFTGMQTDMGELKHPSTFLKEAKNVRLTARDKDTLLTVTNERGPLYTGISISGIYLGYCLINNYLVVFSTTAPLIASDKPNGSRRVKDEYINNITDTEMTSLADSGQANPVEEGLDSLDKLDYITRIDLNTLDTKVLYEGNLGFSTEHPIEAIPSYENAQIQKVYWTDGLNQPRVINIMGNILTGVDSQFDFVRELALQEEVKIQKQLGSAGMFAPGVIQYALTYYTKYGQESNIFYTSPLLYTSYKERGGSPEDKVANAFKITVATLDPNFDYVRVYSIHRTSVNGIPEVKRVQDIEIKSSSTGELLDEVSYLDTGMSGDAIDPTELLYKGGESIVAQTIEQKDNTLFLGNITLLRPSINKELKKEGISIEDSVKIKDTTRTIYTIEDTAGGYQYSNQLTAFSDEEHTNSTSCGGFKHGDYYRCGVQFQYKDGKWSDPLFIKDKDIGETPSIDSSSVTLPALKGTLSKDLTEAVTKLGYKKARAVVVFPEMQDRVTICQGVLCPTMYTNNHRITNKDLYAQSSWFFRPSKNVESPLIEEITGTSIPKYNGLLNYDDINDNSYNPIKTYSTEIQGTYTFNDQFTINHVCSTMHSPDIEFDEDILLLDLGGLNLRKVGQATFEKTFSDIDIQTESATISNAGSGFVHKAFQKDGAYGIVAGLYYEDFIVDDDGGEFRAYTQEKKPAQWVIYPWQRKGSLNNDIDRPADKGTRSAVLKKKVISNLRWTTTKFTKGGPTTELQITPKVFSSNQLSIVKLDDKVYQGNIDTMLVPTDKSGSFLYNEETHPVYGNLAWWKITASKEDPPKNYGMSYWTGSQWTEYIDTSIGNKYPQLAATKEHVRMKYKSTPHIVLKEDALLNFYNNDSEYVKLPIVELYRKGDEEGSYYRNTMFGGTNEDAKKANLWIPCGEPAILGNGEEEGTTVIHYLYGDTYFQRWDCLKTYAFTPEDENQIVEIGSFVLESRINMDGRYDRNRGQLNNTMMSPINFNLLNPVYSQINNFFSYRILDEDYYNIDAFPNQITWSKEKQSGADVDLWTNLTLASTYDLDGSKGYITSLKTWKGQIFCFQDRGVSNILFNSRVQIQASDGVPIEISNNYKVDGYRYLSDGIGCVNKWTITATPSGIYFINTIDNHLFHISEGVQDITTSHNITTIFNNKDKYEVVSTLYDNINHDLYILFNKTSLQKALCYSEMLGQFTSFMDYDRLALLESANQCVYTMRDNKLYKMFKGDYNSFFDYKRPWYITFMANGVDNGTVDYDKTFTNIDYRMSMFLDNEELLYKPDATFTYIQVDNEYQDTGKVLLSRLKSINNTKSYHHKEANLQKKFKTWRVQIPRHQNSLDRIRNQWCRIKLENDGQNSHKAILHDLNVQYYI